VAVGVGVGSTGTSDIGVDVGVGVAVGVGALAVARTSGLIAVFMNLTKVESSPENTESTCVVNISTDEVDLR
jgi:hypothetical protein